MKVTVTPRYWGSVSVRELATYIAGELDSNSYDNGRLEDMRDSLSKIRDAFGRLIEVLVESKTIDLTMASAIVYGDELSEAP